MTARILYGVGKSDFVVENYCYNDAVYVRHIEVVVRQPRPNLEEGGSGVICHMQHVIT